MIDRHFSPFSGRFVADGNYPDGTFLLPGEHFRKTWILLNDGSLPWDNESIRLVNLINQIRFVEQPIVSVTAPHTRTEIHVDFVAPMESGVYESKWILSYRDQTFGPMFWCQIEVRQNDDVPLPACFDLTKPFSLPKPIDDPVEKLTNDFERIDDFLEITNESVSLPPPLSPIRSESVETPRPINTVMNSFVSVARQAGSTAKAIFNTLQANDEVKQSELFCFFLRKPFQLFVRLVIEIYTSNEQQFFCPIDRSDGSSDRNGFCQSNKKSASST